MEHTKKSRLGRVLVLTGDGKGKSSSAFGMAFRAAGWGMKVCVIQFIKGAWPTGEEKAAKMFDNLEWHALGDGFTWKTEDPEGDRLKSREIWDFCRQKAMSGEFDLVVFDEINMALGFGWLTDEEVVHFIREERPKSLHLVLTGRNAPKTIMDAADTVTEMTLIKHAFDNGIKACKGVEF